MSVDTIGMAVDTVGVSIGYTAFGGCVFARREVDAGVAVKKVDGLQVEANHLNGHDWKVLQPRGMLW